MAWDVDQEHSATDTLALQDIPVKYIFLGGPRERVTRKIEAVRIRKQQQYEYRYLIKQY